MPLGGMVTGLGDDAVRGLAGVVKRMANPIAQPMVHSSPFINKTSQILSEAEDALNHERGQAAEILNTLKEAVGLDPAGPLRVQLADVLEGKLPIERAHPNVVKAALLQREVYQDFAQRQGLGEREIADYMNRMTDWDAIYAQQRRQLLSASSLGDLPADMQARIGTDEVFNKLRWTTGKNAAWDTLPSNTKKQLRILWGADDERAWSSAPASVRNAIPKEIFFESLLPRTGRAPYKRDPVAALDRYMEGGLRKIHFDPAVKQIQEMLGVLPPEGGLATERGYIERMLNNAVFRYQPWDEKAVGHLTNKVNDIVGTQLLRPETIDAGVTALRGAFYRGSLGVDSAIVNLTQPINDWMEQGMLLKPMRDYVMGRVRLEPAARGLIGDSHQMLQELNRRSSPGVASLVTEVDGWMSKIFLTPHNLAEGINRNLAAVASLESSAAKRAYHLKRGETTLAALYDDVDKVVVNAAAAASRVFQPLKLSRAAMRAIYQDIPRAHFGTRVGQRSPYMIGPLGRMSSILMTYPVNQTMFMYRGITEAIKASDDAKLLRYMVGTGMMVYLPVLAAQMGMDIRKQFGLGGALGNLSFPAWEGLMNGYRAITGYDPMTRAESERKWNKFLTQMAIPQYRYGEKVANVVENLSRSDQRGLDAHGRYVYETTPYGELLRLVGIGSEDAFQARRMGHLIAEHHVRRWQDRQEAISLYLDNGDPSGIAAYTESYDEAITNQDVQRVMKRRAMNPAERAMSRLPKDQAMRAFLNAEGQP